MPKFETSVPHSLGKEAALGRLQGFSDVLREKHSDKIKDLQQDWDGDQMTFSFKTLGIAIGGTMTVDDAAVTVAGDLPFAAAMFKGQIVGAITEQLQKLVG